MRGDIVSVVRGACVIACSSEVDDRSEASSAQPLSYHRDIKPILDAKCGGCHVEGGIAPFSLGTYEDAAAHAGAIAANVSARVMPPWGAAPDVREYRFDASLTDAQIATIEQWVGAGAPEGDPSRTGAPLSVESSELSRVDVTLELAEPYVPVITPNEYRCFVLEWPYDHPVYVTGFDARPGNASIVHHIQAYLALPADVPTVEAFDAADPDPGYACFGAPNPEGSDPLLTRTLGGWTPGRGGMELPEGTGVLIEPGSKVLLQMHYHTASANAEADRSSLLMTVEEAVEQVGNYIPWTDSAWAIDPTTMLIPAGAEETRHTYRALPEDSLVFSVFSGGAEFPNGFYIHTIYPHTHTLAKTIEGAVVRASGEREVLVSVPRWDFDWQREYVLADPVFVAPGDQIEVGCTWSNTLADQPFVDGVQQPPHDVVWGEGTEDEMCSIILYATEGR